MASMSAAVEVSTPEKRTKTSAPTSVKNHSVYVVDSALSSQGLMSTPVTPSEVHQSHPARSQEVLPPPQPLLSSQMEPASFGDHDVNPYYFALSQESMTPPQPPPVPTLTSSSVQLAPQSAVLSTPLPTSAVLTAPAALPLSQPAEQRIFSFQNEGWLCFAAVVMEVMRFRFVNVKLPTKDATLAEVIIFNSKASITASQVHLVGSMNEVKQALLQRKVIQDKTWDDPTQVLRHLHLFDSLELRSLYSFMDKQRFRCPSSCSAPERTVTKHFDFLELIANHMVEMQKSAGGLPDNLSVQYVLDFMATHHSFFLYGSNFKPCKICSVESTKQSDAIIPPKFFLSLADLGKWTERVRKEIIANPTIVMRKHSSSSPTTWKLTARAYSTHWQGFHFYVDVVVPAAGVYRFDSMKPEAKWLGPCDAADAILGGCKQSSSTSFLFYEQV